MTDNSPVNWFPVEYEDLAEQAQLVADTTDFWLLDLTGKGQKISRLKKLLDETEQARARAYRFREHRHRYILRRAFQRIILGAYCAVEPSQLEYDTDHPEKPALPAASGISFSAANSGNLGLLSVSHLPVGIDLEHMLGQPALDLVAKDNFTKFEQERLQGLSRDNWLRGFTRLWTQKEAVLKLQGIGLSMSPLEITVADSQDAARWTDPQKGPESWSLHTFQADDLAIATAATSVPIRHTRFFRFGVSA
ncbi:4'-phosphopantetheinyl transferase superfamily protein [Parvularcula sp. IMCC14364]|uniref:4'-phosphopantetheinyl transferase family protein n=1 Tax=Parvularcula sp. IMCC14364 TaxID=3067902 RepID=UPI002741E0B8|nr:4'-phosphopantetheinyl transferase superfamily protein [Parvularcula sp. IMCC14364]